MCSTFPKQLIRLRREKSFSFKAGIKNFTYNYNPRVRIGEGEGGRGWKPCCVGLWVLSLDDLTFVPHEQHVYHFLHQRHHSRWQRSGGRLTRTTNQLLATGSAADSNDQSASCHGVSRWRHFRLPSNPVFKKTRPAFYVQSWKRKKRMEKACKLRLWLLKYVMEKLLWREA